MSDYDNVLPFMRGPGPRPSKRTRTSSSTTSTPPAPAPAPARTLPTRWRRLANGLWYVENPNVCDICHRRTHPDTHHHAFLATLARPAYARAAGWPMPTGEEPTS